jgi:hypothetical protein
MVILCKTLLFDIRAKLKRSKIPPLFSHTSILFQPTLLIHEKNNNILKDAGFRCSYRTKEMKSFKCGINIYNV